MRVPPTLLALCLLAALALCAPGAFAWTEARPSGLSTEVAVDRDGGATVTLRMRWRVLAGRLRTFDLTELPPDLTLVEATGTDPQGAPVTVTTRAPGPGRLEVTLGDGEGLRRGVVNLVLRYTTSLRAQGQLRREGSDALLEFSTLPWERGLEATELRFVIPSSVRRARWASEETPGVEAETQSELGRDLVHATRRHLAPGARWTGRVAADPALFPWLDGPRVVALSHHNGPALDRRPVLAASLLAALLALLVVRAFGRGVEPQGALVPWLHRRRFVAPALGALGAALQPLAAWHVSGVLTVGLLLLAAALALQLPRSAALGEARDAARLWPDPRAASAAEARALPNARGRLVALCLGVLLSLCAVGWGLAWHRVLPGALGLDAALLLLALAVRTRELAPASDFVLLLALRPRLSTALCLGTRTRLGWRVRAEGSLPGSVRLRWMPRPGYRVDPALRSLDVGIDWHRGSLRWRGRPTAWLRVALGSSLEAPARELAAEYGELGEREERGALCVELPLTGPGRRAMLSALARLLQSATRKLPKAAPAPAPSRATDTLPEASPLAVHSAATS